MSSASNLFGALFACACFSVGAQTQHARVPVLVDSETVAPQSTSPDIDGSLGGLSNHYVAAPHSSSDRFPILVVFLGGSLSSTSDYTGITDEAAGLGYGAIDLNYPNNHVVGTVCNQDDVCFREYRGEVNYGKDVYYGTGSQKYNAGSKAGNINLANSIVNRLVSLLDYLSYEAPGTGTIPDATFWSQFLIPDQTGQSPYFTQPHTVKIGGTPGATVFVAAQRVYPDWSKIIIAGHSQGGGHAAFMGMLTPVPMRRVVMFSAPNDNSLNPVTPAPPNTTPCCTATWMVNTPSGGQVQSVTSLQQFWGMRTDNEGSFGNFTGTNWANMGGYGTGGLGLALPASGEISNVTGSELTPNSSYARSNRQRIVLNQVSNISSFANHNNSAVYNSNIHTRTPPVVAPAWDYLLTGGYTEQYH